MADTVFGNRLRELRRQIHMTQQEVADQLQIHRTTYTKYETGVVEPPLATLCRMADLMNCTTDELLGRK